MPGDEDWEEVDEIDEDNIKKLAAQAAGGGGDDEEDEGEEAAETPHPAASAGGAGAVELDVERLKSTIDMLKEQDGSMQDRVQTLSQRVGEIRQMAHEQETTVTDIEADVSRLLDQVSKIEPQEFDRRLSSLRADIDGNADSIERVEEKLQRVEQIATDVQDTLNSLGSMQNLIEMNKDFEEKLNEIQEAQRYIERLAQKSEKINVQINKKLTEYNTYKARVDALQEKVSDMYQQLDTVSIDVEDAVKQDGLEEIRERIHELEEQLEEYSKIAPLADMSLPEPIAELREEREDIEAFLEDLEQQYEEGKVEASEYEKIKEANEEKLDRIKQQLIEEWHALEEGVDAEDAAPEQDAEEDTESEAEEGAGESDAADEDEAEKAVDDAAAEADEPGDEEEESGADYEEIVDQSVTEVQADVREMNLDIAKVIEAEKAGENRDTLLEWLETRQGEEEDEEEEEIDYEAIADQPEDDVKEAVESQDLDLTELLKAERNNQNRGELLEWIEGRLTDQG